jgi:hypothetical protein
MAVGWAGVAVAGALSSAGEIEQKDKPGAASSLFILTSLC